MLKCQLCYKQPQTPQLTKCCKYFVCESCKDRYQKIGTCACMKPINKKLCMSNPELFDIIRNYYEARPIQCDRCEKNAELQCLDCIMVYCSGCNFQVHNAKGFAKHVREIVEKEIKTTKKTIDKTRMQEQWCNDHKQIYDFVGECGQFLCNNCIKTHRQTCSKFAKPKPMKEYKEEYFGQIMTKIKKISEYKEKLQQQKQNYAVHFKKQKQTFQSYSKLVDEQLEGLKKIFDMKIIEIKSRVADYWKQSLQAHCKNENLVDQYLKRYDDLGRLSERFVYKMVGLDYLEKRVKRIYINRDFFNFKLQGIEDVQFCILNMSTYSKPWELHSQDQLTQVQENYLEDKGREKKNDLGPYGMNSQLFLQCSQNPLQPRPLVLKSSHNQISFQFLHLPHRADEFQVEYGVGLKMKGQQVFKRLAVRKGGSGIINSLNTSTKYRLRMRVAGGEWGPISEVKTMQMPRFLTDASLMSSKNLQQNSLQSLKTGTIYGSNQINFGVHSWQIKVYPPKNTDEETACISVGVSNKQTKKPVFVGTTLNYGYQKAMLSIKVTLSCDDNRMTISNSTGSQEETYQNLPNLPLFPTIQNKGSYPIQIQCIFT